MATKTQISEPGAWKNTRTGVGIGKSLYTNDRDGKLYVTNAKSGEWAVLGEGYFTKFLVAGGNTDGDLYAIDKAGTLYKVDTDTGEWTQFGDDGAWADTVAIDAVGDSLYVVDEAGKLWNIELEGEIEEIGENYDSKALWGWQDHVYVLENDGTLYKTDAESGEYEAFGDETAYAGTRAATIHNGTFYTVNEDGSLGATSIEDGGYEEDNEEDLSEVRNLFSANGALYAIEKDGTLYRIDP
jgi:hypothetical protein